MSVKNVTKEPYDEWFYLKETPRNGEEQAIVDSLRANSSLLEEAGISAIDTQVWLFSDVAGDWLLATVDVTRNGVVTQAYRIDFGGGSVIAVASPGLLNWDAELRIRDCGIDLTNPDHAYVDRGASDVLARKAIAWIVARIL